jgi:hypothetical protein
MKILCSWCKKDMGEKPPLEDRDITHGLCTACAKKIEVEFAAFQEQQPAASLVAGF